MEDKSFEIRCPFCGGIMIWNSDYMTSEAGITDDGKKDRMVKFYSCSKCGCSGEFVENDE